MDVGVHCGPGGLGGGLEQGSHIDVHAQVGVGGGYHLLSPVVAVLAHLGDVDTRPAAFFGFECVGHGDGFFDVTHGTFLPYFILVYAGQGADLRLMAPEYLFEGVGDFADGGLGAGGIHGQLEQVFVQVTGLFIFFGGGCGERLQGGLHGCFVTLGAQLLQLGQLFGAHFGVVHLEHFDLLVFGHHIFVHADEGLPAGVDTGLGAGGGFLDAELRNAFDGGLGHAAGGLHFFDVGAGPLRQLFGEPLNVVGASPWVDGPHRAGFLLQQQLGVPGNAGGEVGGQGQCLIQRIGVQRLGVALGCGHGLNAGARHVIEHVLGGQRPTGCLRVCAQRL